MMVSGLEKMDLVRSLAERGIEEEKVQEEEESNSAAVPTVRKDGRGIKMGANENSRAIRKKARGLLL